MQEQVLHWLWQQQYFNHPLVDTLGNTILVIHKGQYNTNQGPDFSNARIAVNGLFLAGNIEIHVKESDWISHNHTDSTHYNNIILHVVWELDDFTISQRNNIAPHTVCLKNQLSIQHLDKVLHFATFGNTLPCLTELVTIPTITQTAWLERLSVERLYQKADLFLSQLQKADYDWNKVLLWAISRYLNSPVNHEAIQSAFKHIAMATLYKIADNPLAVEAMFFGLIQKLNHQPTDAHTQALKMEFEYLSHRFKLQPQTILLSYGRMRPNNFPDFRLAQMAAIYHKGMQIEQWFQSEGLHRFVMHLTNLPVNNYWQTHYMLGVTSDKHATDLGKQTIHKLWINAIVPLLMAYSKYYKRDDIYEFAFEGWNAVDAESNAIVKKFKTNGIQATKAAHTQALIQLHEKYCKNYQCLSCAFGNFILSNSKIAQ